MCRNAPLFFAPTDMADILNPEAITRSKLNKKKKTKTKDELTN